MITKHQPLFEPYTFPSGLSVANRIVLAPMTTWSSNPDGTIHDDELAYLRRRSNGPGMVMTAACYVVKEGHAFENQWGCHRDEMLESLARACTVIQSQGAKAILQIHHGGRMCPSAILGHAPLCASAVPASRPDADTPREMTETEIRATIAAFGDAARRAVETGYDGVEIHGANTYLLQQFFSPHSNRRTDAWGGSLEKRMRFPLAVLEEVQKAAAAIPRPFAVGYRLSPEEIEEPGITIEDTLAFVDALARRRPDWLHISLREYLKGSIRDRSDDRRPASRIVEHLSGLVPVIGVGKVYSPDDAMFILNDGCALVAIGRIALMEPEWVLKVRAMSDKADGRDENERIRLALPEAGGDTDLTLPTRMYNRLLAVKGWLPVSASGVRAEGLGIGG